MTQKEKDEMRQEMLEEKYNEDQQENRLHSDLDYAMETIEVYGYSLAYIDDLITRLSHKLSECGHEVSKKEILENL